MTRKRAKKLLMSMGYSRNFAAWALNDSFIPVSNLTIVEMGAETKARVYRQYLAPKKHLFPVGRWPVSINFIPGLGCKPQLTFIIYGTNPW